MMTWREMLAEGSEKNLRFVAEWADEASPEHAEAIRRLSERRRIAEQDVERTGQIQAAQRVAMRRWLRDRGAEVDARCNDAGTAILRRQVLDAGGDPDALMSVAAQRVRDARGVTA